MSNATGTLEAIAIELSKLLAPLARDLATPAKAKVFFAQMGFMLSDAQVASIAVPLSTAATSTSDLAAIVTALLVAIDAEDYGTLTQKSIDTIKKIAAIINALSAIGTQLSGIVGGVTASEVARRLFDHLLFNYLKSAKEVNDALEFIGLLNRDEHNEDSEDPNNPPFTIATYHFDHIGGWFSDPAGQVRALYDWGNSFDGHKLFSRIENILAREGLPVIFDDTGAVPRLDVVLLEAVPKTDVTPHGLLIKIKNSISSGQQTVPFGSDGRGEFKFDFQVPLNTGLSILPDGKVSFVPATPGGSFSGDFLLKVIAERTQPPAPFILFGKAGSSRLELGQFTLTTGARVTMASDGSAANGDFILSGDAEGLKVIIDTSSGDGFLAKILPGTKVEANFNVQVGVSTQRGFYFGGSSALEVHLPAHIDLGPVALQGLTLAAKLQGGKIPVSVGADIRASLGPIVAVVQNMGVTATFSFPPGNSGNLGPLQFDIGFKPPNGVGLSIDTGVIKGGGILYFNPDKGQYFGALELSFEDTITLKAVGIINTKMPDGSQGFALLILVTAEFTPIQLGFGFTLIGVGGLLALNHTLDTEALRSGIRTGAVSSILFPQDVVANITRIISDLNMIFPIAQNHLIIGPMGKLGWGTPTLISLEIGVILDIPQPQLTILGVLRCILPAEDAAILKLQVNFAGGIDFKRGLIWFDASLFDSSLLIYTLTGDMALRIGWGEQTIFVISVGGFHPAFKEVPPDLRSMRRLSIALLSGENPRLTVQTYFAITSNTVQSGARAELYAEACGFNIYGFLGYDLLVQFSPFHFIASIDAGLALREGTDVLFGIGVHCQLSGPTPWHVQGEASFSILFFDISIPFDATWGQDAPRQIEQTVNVLPLVKAAVSDDRNWSTSLPANTHSVVTLKKLELPPGRIICSPFAILEVSQKIVPLGVDINKFGNQRPTGTTLFELKHDGNTDEVREEFAMANFLTMSDSEKLTRKSFERMRSGLRFSTGDSSLYGANAQKEVSYELSYVHRKKRSTIRAGLVKFLSSALNIFSKGGAIARNAYSVSKFVGGTPPVRIDVGEQVYMVVHASDLTLHAPEMVTKTSTEAYLLHDQLIAANPALSGKVLVVSSHELS